MDWDYDTVRASYDRCLEFGGFFDAFYEAFLSKSADIPPMFAATDFERQKQVLAESISYMLIYSSDMEFTEHTLDDIAKKHSRNQRNIEPKFYSVWLDSLCETIQKHDPEWSPELDQQWRLAMKPGIELMIAAY